MMKNKRILLLSSSDSPLLPIIRSEGHDVVCTNDRIDSIYVKEGGFDFLISYGHRHILRADVLSYFQPRRAVNLHISFLPYNRGADPNFWSLYEGTPRGVSIHYMDEGVDTGDIIAQKNVLFDEEIDTLSTSYAKLHSAIVELFRGEMGAIFSGTCSSCKQSGRGTYHKVSDKAEIFAQLQITYPNVWEAPIKQVIALGKRNLRQ